MTLRSSSGRPIGAAPMLERPTLPLEVEAMPPTSVETSEFAAFARRVVSAHARRVGAGDVEALRELVALREHLDAATVAAVAELRSEAWRYSWADVARVLGVTRQAAQQRFGRTPATKA